MGRILAGIAAFLLLITGATLMWRGDAQTLSHPRAPMPRFAALAARDSTSPTLSPLGQAPLAEPRSKEEKRFARADKNEDGRINLAEMVEPRRKAFAKLDVNQDGRLGFEEWAIKTIDKFEGADGDKNEALSPGEYAATAPKHKAKPACVS
jgi:EF hand